MKWLTLLLGLLIATSAPAQDIRLGAGPMHVPVLEARVGPDWAVRPTCQIQAAQQWLGDGLVVFRRAAGVEPGEDGGHDVFWPLACSLEIGVR